jgi:hypothetical protein
MLILDHFSPDRYGEALSDLRHSQIIDIEQEATNRHGPPLHWTTTEEDAAAAVHPRPITEEQPRCKDSGVKVLCPNNPGSATSHSSAPVPISMNLSATGLELKESIQAIWNIPTAHQLLYHDQTLLPEDSPLEEAGVTNGAMIHCIPFFGASLQLIHGPNPGETLTIQSRSTVGQLKQRLAEAMKADATDLQITVGTTELADDSRTIQSYGVMTGSKMKASTMQISVKGLKGENITLSVNGSDTVLQAKRAIQELNNIPTGQQNLIFAGQQLKNERTLEDYGGVRNSTLHLVLQLRGGPRRSDAGGHRNTGTKWADLPPNQRYTQRTEAQPVERAGVDSASPPTPATLTDETEWRRNEALDETAKKTAGKQERIEEKPGRRLGQQRDQSQYETKL